MLYFSSTSVICIFFVHQTKILQQAEVKSRSTMKLFVILAVFAAFGGNVVSRNLEEITLCVGYINVTEACLCLSQVFSRKLMKYKLKPSKSKSKWKFSGGGGFLTPMRAALEMFLCGAGATCWPGGGGSYAGDVSRSSSGKRCLNWRKVAYSMGIGDHNYCR